MSEPDACSSFCECYGDPLFVVSAERVIIYCNPAFEKMLGRSREEIIGKKCAEALAGLPEHRCPLPQMLAVGGPNRREFPMQVVGSHRLHVIVDQLIDQATGNTLGFGHTVVDITRHYNDKVRDHLTGLFNRRYMEETLSAEWHRAKRKNYPLGIMMLDLDHFKNYNDTHGHQAGDELLRRFGKLLLKQVRASDIVCRYGGEEFTVILPEAPQETVLSRAKRIISAVREKLPITVSIGIAVFPQHGDLAENVIRVADAALYRAKREGRDRVAVAE